MGKNNRARRAAKQRREHRNRSGPSPSQDRPPSGRSTGSAPTLDELVWRAADAFRFREPIYEPALAALTQLDGVDAVVEQHLALVATTALNGHGWLPDDVPRIVARKLGATHAARAARVALAVGLRLARGYTPSARWQASLDAIGERAAATSTDGHGVRVGVELLSFLRYLPRLPEVEPPPGRAPVGRSAAPRSGESSRQLDRIRALLAKAESTTFPEEAEALTAKAQELIARHSIDTALLQAEHGGTTPVSIRIWLDDPYSGAKALLLNAIANANGGRATWSADMGVMVVFGLPHDIDAVELLYTSLRVQAVTAMTQVGAVRDRNGRSRTRSFRRSFLEGFAHRIGERLRVAADIGVDGARAEVGDAALLPVLRRRDDDVAAAQREAFPHMVSRAVGPRTYHPGGWAAGTTAADIAHLGVAARALADPP